jgi:hypothetical protein
MTEITERGLFGKPCPACPYRWKCTWLRAEDGACPLEFEQRSIYLVHRMNEIAALDEWYHEHLYSWFRRSRQRFDWWAWKTGNAITAGGVIHGVTRPFVYFWVYFRVWCVIWWFKIKKMLSSPDFWWGVFYSSISTLIGLLVLNIYLRDWYGLFLRF